MNDDDLHWAVVERTYGPDLILFRARYDDCEHPQSGAVLRRIVLESVLRLPAIGSKRFLTNKVDLDVTGLVIQRQLVGPRHLPVAERHDDPTGVLVRADGVPRVRDVLAAAGRAGVRRELPVRLSLAGPVASGRRRRTTARRTARPS